MHEKLSWEEMEHMSIMHDSFTFEHMATKNVALMVGYRHVKMLTRYFTSLVAF